jgi:hypothetical protein
MRVHHQEVRTETDFPDVRVSHNVCAGTTWEEKLCRGAASAERKEKEIVGKGRSESDKCCFDETGDAVNGSERVARCGLVMACNADGAVVVVSRIFMVVRCHRECGKKEKQYQERGNSTTADHGFPFTHGGD